MLIICLLALARKTKMAKFRKKKKTFIKENPKFDLQKNAVFYEFAEQNMVYVNYRTGFIIDGIVQYSKFIHNTTVAEQDVILKAIKDSKHIPKQQLITSDTIWSKLVNLERKAATKAQVQSKVLFIPTPAGFEALIVLNTIMDFDENKKFNCLRREVPFRKVGDESLVVLSA